MGIRTDIEIAGYDSLEEYLVKKRAEPRRAAWKIFTELLNWVYTHRQQRKNWNCCKKPQLKTRMTQFKQIQTVDAVDKDFHSEGVLFDTERGFIYVYHYPDELFNCNLVKDKAPTYSRKRNNQGIKLVRLKIVSALNQE